MPVFKFRDARAHAAAIMGSAADRKKRMIAAIREAVMEGESIAQGEVDATNPKPVDRGDYRRSFRYARTPNGAVLYNSSPIAGVIEHGRRPGRGISKEGQEALAGWVMRKGLVGRRGPREDRMQAARGLAFVIARAIKRRGLPGKFVMRRTQDKLTPKVLAAVERALAAPSGVGS